MPVVSTNNIFFGSTEMDSLKVGNSTVDKVYLGSDLVYSGSSEVLTVSISNAGNFTALASNYATTQRSTDGSGTGATFQVTLVASGIPKIMSVVTSITSGGTGYAVGDLITLDFTSIADGNENTYGILEVDSVG